jgi:hypothetical protein
LPDFYFITALRRIRRSQRRKYFGVGGKPNEVDGTVLVMVRESR